MLFFCRTAQVWCFRPSLENGESDQKTCVLIFFRLHNTQELKMQQPRQDSRSSGTSSSSRQDGPTVRYEPVIVLVVT